MAKKKESDLIEFESAQGPLAKSGEVGETGNRLQVFGKILHERAVLSWRKESRPHIVTSVQLWNLRA